MSSSENDKNIEQAAPAQEGADNAQASQEAARLGRAYHRKSNVRIIVDSCADFAPEVAEALGVEVVHFTYVMSGQEYADDLYLRSVNVSAAGSSISGYPYADWAMEAGRTAGDVTVEESESTTSCLYYVVLFQGRERDDSNTADVRHILVAAEQDEGADQPTQAQYDAAYAEAEELLEQWKAGEATEDSFAALAQEHSADTGSAANGGLITGISASSGYVETFADWALDPSRQPGDTGIVQNTGSSTKGWHIMYYVSAGDPIWKQTAFSAMQSEDYDQLRTADREFFCCVQMPFPLARATRALAPRRSAPASSRAWACSKVRMPPAALMRMSGLMCSRKSRTSSAVAPPVEKPVEVLMKSAPDMDTTRQAAIFSSRVSRQASTMTFRMRPLQEAFTALISSRTPSQSPALARPRLITMSISSAPLRMASSVSNTFTSVVE